VNLLAAAQSESLDKVTLQEGKHDQRGNGSKQRSGGDHRPIRIAFLAKKVFNHIHEGFAYH
jgi:hypothetical protein